MPLATVSFRPAAACGVALALLARVAGGCSLIDCSFDGETVTARGRVLETDLDAGGETLAVLFVTEPVPLNVLVPCGGRRSPGHARPGAPRHRL